MYKIPSYYYYRLHHVRPRFKNDVENVLIYIAEELLRIGSKPSEEFVKRVNASIKLFPGNSHKSDKTINNWRTEITSLFGLIITDGEICSPSLRAKELAENNDLVEFFKKFLFTFQYPGAHIKDHETLNDVKKGVRFKPAQYLIKLLRRGEEITGNRAYITKGEFCHCVFNDLRCTSNLESLDSTWGRILSNRKHDKQYDLQGDVIRYAGDIIDYMEIANLLVSYDNFHFYLNSLENETLLIFEKSTEIFSKYNYENPTLGDIKENRSSWFEYVNRDMEKTDFSTNVLSFISKDEKEYQGILEDSSRLLGEKLENVELLRTKDIGDIGEGIVCSHEKQRITIEGRPDLIHLIQRIPTQFAIGYDIQSIEVDERKRYIEVKTTISSKPLRFNKVHLTANEWRTATSVKDRYFIYRLMISKVECKLFIMQDPVSLYKNDLIEMLPKDGADITFYPDKSGKFEDLLQWGG